MHWCNTWLQLFSFNLVYHMIVISFLNHFILYCLHLLKSLFFSFKLKTEKFSFVLKSLLVPLNIFFLVLNLQVNDFLLDLFLSFLISFKIFNVFLLPIHFFNQFILSKLNLFFSFLFYHPESLFLVENLLIKLEK